MNDLEKTIQDRLAPLRELHLSPDSKERMKLELASFADLHSVIRKPVLSPLHTFFSASFLRVSAALLVLIVAASGSAYAAKGTLPGDALYPVKVSVTEPLQTALIPSVKGRAAWHAIIAERRLEEGTKLAVAGKLDTNTKDFISENFSSNVEASISGANQLANSGDITGSLDVRSDLEARITAHETILNQVVDHLTTDGSETDTDTSARAMLALVSETQDDVQDSRLALEDTITGHVADVPVLATAKGKAAPSINARVATPAPQPVVIPAAHIETAAAARTFEINSILAKNATLLADLNASTTATSTLTASTTATSTDVDTNEEESNSN